MWKPDGFPEKDPPTFAYEAWTLSSKTLLRWQTSGSNCEACNALANRVYPYAYWRATVQPGFHDNCDCRLVAAPVGAFESPHDLWGTEPLWWDPTQDVYSFLESLYTRYMNWLGSRDGRDKYSGFDNLFPVFMSQSGMTTAGGSLQQISNTSPLWSLFKELIGLGKDKFVGKYKIRIQGYAFVSGAAGIIWRKPRDPETCLPWENYPHQPTDEPDYPDWY